MYYDKLLVAVKIVLLRGCWSYLRNYFYVKLIVYLKPEITAAEKDVKFLTYFAKQKTQNLKNYLGIGPKLQDTYVFYSSLKDDEILYSK